MHSLRSRGMLVTPLTWHVVGGRLRATDNKKPVTVRPVPKALATLAGHAKQRRMSVRRRVASSQTPLFPY